MFMYIFSKSLAYGLYTFINRHFDAQVEGIAQNLRLKGPEGFIFNPSVPFNSRGTLPLGGDKPYPVYAIDQSLAFNDRSHEIPNTPISL